MMLLVSARASVRKAFIVATLIGANERYKILNLTYIARILGPRRNPRPVPIML
jgi:hypothetical protein